MKIGEKMKRILSFVLVLCQIFVSISIDTYANDTAQKEMKKIVSDATKYIVSCDLEKSELKKSKENIINTLEYLRSKNTFTDETADTYFDTIVEKTFVESKLLNTENIAVVQVLDSYYDYANIFAVGVGETDITMTVGGEN